MTILPKFEKIILNQVYRRGQSVRRLRGLPWDQLRIDQSSMSVDASQARTIVILGQCTGLPVIVESVETEGPRDFLNGQVCHACQVSL